MTGQSAANKDVEIAGLATDSRKIRPGYLFAALPGTLADGRAFVADAVEHGAAAVLAPLGSQLDIGDVPVIEDAEPRRRLALMAARCHARQPETVCAVTGTNGKTSVAGFVRQIWAGMNLDAASIGTLGVATTNDAGSSANEGPALTTPDPVMLHETLDRLADDGISHLAMEASSHGLAQFRLDGVRMQAAAFTNLTRDHLDYHGTEAAYMAAKARLFTELLPADGIAVLNADVPQFDHLARLCAGRGIRILSYGREGLDIRILRITPQDAGQLVELEVCGRRHDLRLPLVGTFQVANVACALGLVIACGGEAEAAVAALPRLSGVPGRMQPAGTLPNGAACFVDYAHTPDALANALRALRPHAARRLVVVFGCGGDRDRGKRAEMGQIAARGADVVIVTDDNPRSEDPAGIRDNIRRGAMEAAELYEIADRGEAIDTAVASLRAGDVLLVAGKGHERGQIIRSRVLPFSDMDAVRAAIGKRGGQQ